jgi:hypothetical protein
MANHGHVENEGIGGGGGGGGSGSVAACSVGAPPTKRIKEDERWVVASTEYPTTYGCHRGRSYGAEEFWALSKVETFECESEKVALAKATELARQSVWFDEGGCGEGAFGSEPPYDSADLQNYDNDTEQLIEVLTLEAHNTRSEQRLQAIEANYKEMNDMAVAAEECARAAIAADGSVHYSWPPRPSVDVAASDAFPSSAITLYFWPVHSGRSRYLPLGALLRSAFVPSLLDS